MTSVEVMNESRRRKRINKAAQQLASAAAEAAAPSKKIRLTEGEDGVMKVGGGSDGEDDSGDDANADIIMSMTKEERAIRAKAAKKASSSHVKDMTEKKTSTTKQKALARLRERQEREANRSVLLEELAKHSISASETAIMKSSSKLGKAKQTKKERLQQALKEERIGIKVTDSTGLVVGMDTGGMSARKARKLALEAKERELQSSGGEDDEEEEDGEDEGGGGEDVEDGEEGEEVVGEGGGDQDMEDAGDDRDGASEETIGGGDGEAGEGGSAKDGKSGGKHQKKSKADTGGEHKHKKTTAKEEGGGERKPAFFVRVKRHPSIQEVRSKLPMFAEEQQVMEAIKYNDVVVLCGATGSGKSTQLPQFLYEAGYGHPEGHPGMIGCTQPRRVAAITTGRRVAKEMNAPIGKEVGFQVRWDDLGFRV
jgi:ATP-dependent RNA helicase DHX37/DHR1